MKLYVESIHAIKPGIIRVKAYTTVDDAMGADYELALLVQDFTTNKDGHIQIDVDKFKLLVSEQIVAMVNTAELAKALMVVDLEWEIKPNEVQEPTAKSVDGLSLAYGDKE